MKSIASTIKPALFLPLCVVFLSLHAPPLSPMASSGLCQTIESSESPQASAPAGGPADSVPAARPPEIETLGSPGSSAAKNLELPVVLPPGAVLRLITLDCREAVKGWERLLKDLNWDSSTARESVAATRLFLKIDKRLETIFGPGCPGAGDVIGSFDGPGGIWVYDVSDTIFLIWGRMSTGSKLAASMASQGKWLPRDMEGATLRIRRNEEGDAVLGYAERDGYAGISNSTGLLEAFLGGPSTLTVPDPGDGTGAWAAIDLAPSILDGPHFRSYFIDPGWGGFLGTGPDLPEISGVASDIRQTRMGILDRTTVSFDKPFEMKTLGQGWEKFLTAIPPDMAWFIFGPGETGALKSAGEAFGLSTEDLQSILEPAIRECPWMAVAFRPTHGSVAPSIDPVIAIPGDFDPEPIVAAAAELLASRYMALPPESPKALVSEGPAGAFTAGLPFTGKTFHARKSSVGGCKVLIVSTKPEGAQHLAGRPAAEVEVFEFLFEKASPATGQEGNSRARVVRVAGMGPAGYKGFSTLTASLLSGGSVTRDSAAAAGTAGHLAEILSGTNGTVSCRILSPDGSKVTEMTLFRDFGSR